jgi:hypothetical protein
VPQAGTAVEKPLSFEKKLQKKFRKNLVNPKLSRNFAELFRKKKSKAKRVINS